MITIKRQIWGVNIQNIYFQGETELPIDSSVNFVGITQAKFKLEGLKELETLQIDLTKGDEDLLRGMKRKTRQQIRQALQKYSFTHRVSSTPTDDEIHKFKSFYNQHAKVKHIYRCTPYHVQTLKLLRNQNHLLVTTVANENQEILCYRVYAVDGIRAMPLYSVSHYRLEADNARKRMLGLAHRVLIWRNMLWLKANHYQIYDQGGLTSDPNIRSFKHEFGGTAVTVYSGYKANTTKGKLILKIRNLIIKK